MLEPMLARVSDVDGNFFYSQLVWSECKLFGTLSIYLICFVQGLGETLNFLTKQFLANFTVECPFYFVEDAAFPSKYYKAVSWKNIMNGKNAIQ